MTLINRFVDVLLCCLMASAAFADSGNTFTKVRYNGGSVASKVDPKDF